MSVNISTTVYNWLRELKIPVSKTYIHQQLLSHPDYPSLLSITDTLKALGIENAAVQIEKEHLKEVDTPVLAHIRSNGGEFVIIQNSTQPTNFFNSWDGVIIGAEKSKSWRHSLNDDSLKKEKSRFSSLLFIFSLLSSFVILSVIGSFDWTIISLLLIAFAGIFISWLIISKDLGIENNIADQVCGSEADCNAVIHSNVARLPFGVGWSDAGMIWFPFLLLTLIISSFNNTITGVYSALILLSVLSLPVTLVSVYFQWRVIRKWCRLCLATVGLLWVQFIVLMPGFMNIINNGFGQITFTNVAFVFFLFFITAATWLLLKPLIERYKELELENFAAKRFSRNPDIFNALLQKQKKLLVSPDGLGITIGNPTATNTIIKVCNPYCGPCAKAHVVIEKLLEENDNLKVKILFNAADDEKDIKAKPVKHLMALNEKSDRLLIQKALNDWYMADKKDYNVFADKYVLNGELEKQRDKLNAMKTWCDEVKIEFTPTFFINGYYLPKQYTIEDVKYFLEK